VLKLDKIIEEKVPGTYKQSIRVNGNKLFLQSMYHRTEDGIPLKELNLDITDIGLDNWATRHTKVYHQIVVSYKKKSLAIHTQRCTAKAHSRFQSAIVRHNMVCAQAYSWT